LQGGREYDNDMGSTALLLPFVNFLSFHYKCHNQNKADKTKSPKKLEGEADLRFALRSTKPRVELLVKKSPIKQDNDK